MPSAIGAIVKDDFFTLLESGDIADIEAAIQKGQDLEEEGGGGWTPLFVAVRRGGPEVVRLLLDASVNPRDKSGNTALHDSVLGGDEEPALLLLQAGADASVVNNEGVTPIWGASAMGLPRVVSALLERGANPNVRIDGMTPLHIATGVGLLRRKSSGKWESFGEMLKRIGKEETDFLEVTRLLVEAGAEVNALSDLGESETGERGTPLDVAEEGGNTMVAEYLKSVGGRNKKPWNWPL